MMVLQSPNTLYLNILYFIFNYVLLLIPPVLKRTKQLFWDTTNNFFCLFSSSAVLFHN